MHTLTSEHQAAIGPRRALEILQEGNRRFVGNLRVNRNLLQQVNETSSGQFPVAAILSCMDSRTSAELIFDQGLGDIFSIRIAGNVINDDILGSLEFACDVVGVRLIVVLGHTRCGAINGACNDVELGHLTSLLDKIRPSVHAEEAAGGRGEDASAFVERVALANARRQLHQILDRSPLLADLHKEGKIGLTGGIYSVESGEVDFHDTLLSE